ncbi:hypothetical protein BC936DRAFT_147472 [Jimgerdemannia flammicorona]|uniref:L domain-like protein n=1 Tax=Jimgerdemannia flammicorona TaxID=994334 RepID=A0A433D596_9FUNG|nr:hypothetical protein BC936DRAFT_147472 [Jimgerdemannia flammicorona]
MHQRRSPTSRSAILLLLLASLFLVPASASDCLVVAQLFKTDYVCCGASTTSTKVTCDTYDEVTEIVHDARNASLDPSQMPTTCDIDVTLGLLKNLRNLTLVNLAVAAGPTACPGWVDWINNLDGLRFLNLTNNFLNESYFNMSSAFNNLKNLTTLILADNSFQTVPKFLANLPQLKALDLSTNSINASDITGPDLPNLERLNITLIYRTPPQMLSTFNSLKTLSVDFRPAFVPCPDVVLCSSLNSSFLNPISQMTWLENLAVISMDLVVPNSIPLWLRDFHALRTLTMRGCTLSGPLPDFLGTLDRLTFMDFSSNHLNGSIPEGRSSQIPLQRPQLPGGLKQLYPVPDPCRIPGSLRSLQRAAFLARQYLRPNLERHGRHRRPLPPGCTRIPLCPPYPPPLSTAFFPLRLPLPLPHYQPRSLRLCPHNPLPARERSPHCTRIRLLCSLEPPCLPHPHPRSFHPPRAWNILPARPSCCPARHQQHIAVPVPGTVPQLHVRHVHAPNDRVLRAPGPAVEFSAPRHRINAAQYLDRGFLPHDRHRCLHRYRQVYSAGRGRCRVGEGAGGYDSGPQEGRRD